MPVGGDSVTWTRCTITAGGAFAGARRRMGRIAGIFALLIGVANAGIWVLLFQVSSEASLQEGTASMGVGLHMLLVAGVAGVIAGLGAVLTPDRGAEIAERPCSAVR